jgi:hypothetical protein
MKLPDTPILGPGAIFAAEHDPIADILPDAVSPPSA